MEFPRPSKLLRYRRSERSGVRALQRSGVPGQSHVCATGKSANCRNPNAQSFSFIFISLRIERHDDRRTLNIFFSHTALRIGPLIMIPNTTWDRHPGSTYKSSTEASTVIIHNDKYITSLPCCATSGKSANCRNPQSFSFIFISLLEIDRHDDRRTLNIFFSHTALRISPLIMISEYDLGPAVLTN